MLILASSNALGAAGCVRTAMHPIAEHRRSRPRLSRKLNGMPGSTVKSIVGVDTVTSQRGEPLRAATCSLKFVLDQQRKPYGSTSSMTGRASELTAAPGWGCPRCANAQRSSAEPSQSAQDCRAARSSPRCCPARPQMTFTRGRDSYGAHSGADRRRPPALSCGAARLAGVGDRPRAGQRGRRR